MARPLFRLKTPLRILTLACLLTLSGGALAQQATRYEFVRAIEKGDYRAIRMAVLDDHTIVDARDSDGVPVVIIATSKGDVALLQFLLKSEANPDQPQRDSGETALMVAAGRGDAVAVKLLLAYKADVNAEDKRGESALIRAVREGHAEAVRVLLDHGADYTMEDYTGRTPLQYAREARRTRIAGMLEKAGASY